MEQAEQEKEIAGYNIVQKPFPKENAVKGTYCFHALLPETQLVKIFDTYSTFAKIVVWSDSKGKFTTTNADYDDLYIKVQVPVYA